MQPADSWRSLTYAQVQPNPAAPAEHRLTPGNGTVVLDVDGGAVVPSFLGKPLRSAVEIAQQSGGDQRVGSGVAREQWPAPGSHLPAGQQSHRALQRIRREFCLAITILELTQCAAYRVIRAQLRSSIMRVE